MRLQTKIILTIIFGNVFLGLLFEYQGFTPYQESSSNFEHFIIAFLGTLFLIIIPSFLLGLISRRIFKRLQSNRVFHFIIFNIIGFVFLLIINLNKAYNTWHYNKFQANIDYNESLTKNGGYLDTCMTMVQEDIKSKGILPNDYRILTYSYDQALATLPKDTSNKFYSFEVIYSKTKSNIKSVRAASYLIDLNGRIKKVYDVDMQNEKAKKQIEILKKDFRNLKKVLEEHSASSNSQIEELNKKFEAFKYDSM